MPDTTIFFRLLADDDKAAALAAAIDEVRAGRIAAPRTHLAAPESFRQVPGSPFAYWVNKRVLRKFVELPPFESEGRAARRGPSTGDDSRRVRAWWEVSPGKIGRDRSWVPFSKGGAYSPYYADIHLVVAWDESRRTFRDFWGRPGRMIERPESLEYFFRPGLTWPRRTTSGISVRVLPEGCVFADKGPTAFSNNSELMPLLALMNSRAFEGLLTLQLGAADVAARSYEVGLVQATPVPDLSGTEGHRLGDLAEGCFVLKRACDMVNETSHVFHLPVLLWSRGLTIAEAVAAWGSWVGRAEQDVAKYRREIGDTVYRLYDIPAEDRQAIESSLRRAETHAATHTGAERESLAEHNSAEPADSPSTADPPTSVADLISYAFGCSYGRWNVRIASWACAEPPMPGPFDPLPVCSPGMLAGPDGLPAREPPPDYPLRVDADGFLVDDPIHADDIVRRCRDVLALLWPSDDGSNAMAIEQEACEIVGVRNLREYFRKPAGFFADHLKRYSKSRRQAPIYWPLSTASGSYTLWLYYHRLTSDTLYIAANRYVTPKIVEVERSLNELEAGLSGAAGREAARLREQVEDARAFLAELRDFRDELLRVAGLPYKPDLNDGVIINAAPLHRLFRLPKWAKDTKECWQKLERGEYDWAHLAYVLWPDRVRERCRADKSLAIAHGLEDVYIAPPAGEKKARRPAALMPNEPEEE